MISDYQCLWVPFTCIIFSGSSKVLKKRIIFNPIFQIKHSDTENLSWPLTVLWQDVFFFLVLLLLIIRCTCSLQFLLPLSQQWSTEVKEIWEKARPRVSSRGRRGNRTEQGLSLEIPCLVWVESPVLTWSWSLQWVSLCFLGFSNLEASSLFGD